jgi:hypothetical protein
MSAALVTIFVIWIAYLFGLWFYLGGKINRFEARIDAAVRRMDDRLDAVDLDRHVS